MDECTIAQNIQAGPSHLPGVRVWQAVASEGRKAMTERQREMASGRANARGDGAFRGGAISTPGMLAFAALMMFLVGGFELLLAGMWLTGSSYLLVAIGDPVGWGLLVWAIVDFVIALMALYAGYDIVRGGVYGFVFGYLFAVLGAIRWLVFIPVVPVLAVVVILLDVLVIYALTRHSDYFRDVG